MTLYDKTVNFDSPDNLQVNPSFALPQNFRLLIDGVKYKNAMFAVQRATLPDITAEAAPVARPQRNIGFTPDKLTYSDLSVSFLVDEDFTNYTEIHDWMYGGVTVEEDDSKYRDISLLILGSHNNKVREFKFISAFPTNLSSLDFDSTISDADYLVANVTFHYSYFRIY